MKKLFLIAALIAAATMNASAQADKPWRIKSALAFAPGLLTENTQTIQLQGYLGFLHEKIEWRGEAFYFLNSFGDRPRFAMNHQLFTGAFYHFSEKAFQPYVGFQPGIAYSQASEPGYGALNAETQEIEYKKTFNPVGSVAGGFDLFGEKWFFLFVETRYIFGKHNSNSYPIYLDEWRFSFGLGLTF